MRNYRDNTTQIHTPNLDPVPNFCNQELREIITLKHVSVTHVTMYPEQISTPHRHHTMTEIYYILSGKGFFSQDDKRFEVGKWSCVYLPKGSIHMLQNIWKWNLTHLVFAVPPFDSADIDPVKWYLPQSKILPFHKKPPPSFEAADGGIVNVLMTEEQCVETNIGLAEWFLLPYKRAKLHHHDISEEIYYVISGKWDILDENGPDWKLEKDDLMYISKWYPHWLQNHTSKKIEILCLSTPPYKDSDFIEDKDRWAQYRNFKNRKKF